MIRRLTAVLVTFFVAWIAAGSPAEATPAPTSVPHAYVYDGHHRSVGPDGAVSERGPPATTYHYIAPRSAVDTSLHGSSARPRPRLARTYITYDHTVQLAQIASGSGTTRPAHGSCVADMRVVSGVRCAANGADEAFSAGRYLKDTWYKSTFPNRTQSVQYHLAKHGKGRTPVQYTQDAMDFFAQNRSLGQSVILRDGTAGIKIATKQPLPGGGVQRVGGYWTSDGRLVTYWD